MDFFDKIIPIKNLGGKLVEIGSRKLIIVLFLAMSLNFIFTSLAWGSVNIGSLIHYKYDITNNWDFIEANLFFNGKINDDAYAYASLQFTTSTTYPTAPVLNYSTFYFIYNVKPGLGTFTVGCYDNYLSGVILGSSIDKLKSNFGLKFERTIVTGLSYRIGYFPNEIYNSQSAATSGLRYANSNFEADLNVVKFANIDEICYVTNMSYKAGDVFNTYLHHCSDKLHNSNTIIGSTVRIPLVDNPLELSFEYNFAKPAWSNYYYGISYPINKNIIISYLRYIRPSNENELRLSIKW